MEQSLELMKQLLSCGTDIPLWQYDTEGHLVDTNSEHLVLDKILTHIGGIRYMLRYSRKNKKPLVLGSDMGLRLCINTTPRMYRGRMLIGKWSFCDQTLILFHRLR